MSEKILVLGATGNVGKPLVEQLVKQGEKVKAASRGAVSVPAESVRFDFGDPTTFGPAFEGVNRAFFLVPTGTLDAVGLITPVLQAAADRKVKVVLQTAIGVDANDDIPYRRVELFLQRRELPSSFCGRTGSPTISIPSRSKPSSTAPSPHRRQMEKPVSSTAATSPPAPRQP